MNNLISVIIVTHNNESTIKNCVNKIFSSKYPEKEIIVIDNDSRDKTRDILYSFEGIRIVLNSKNAGFSKAMNQGISIAKGDMILSLNPDCFLGEDTISVLATTVNESIDFGTVTPKIVRESNTIDSAGIENSSDIIFKNRGEGNKDLGQYNKREVVFGATGACALYKRKMLESVKIEEEYFDEDFFAYKEDVDLSWRANRAGWKAVYAPEAVVFHQRFFRGFIIDENKGNFYNFKERILYEFKNRHNKQYRFIKKLSFRNNVYLFIKNYDFKFNPAECVFVTVRVIAALIFYLFFEFYVFDQIMIIADNFFKMINKRRFIRTKYSHKQNFFKEIARIC